MTDAPASQQGTTSDVAIEVKSVSFTYRSARPPRAALDGVELKIPASQRVAILGPNGSGKSTLFKLICGLLPLQSGAIHAFGTSSLAERRRHMGIVFQNDSLDPQFTVWENLRDFAALYGVEPSQVRSGVDAALTDSDLFDRRSARVKTLSRGLARRVDLCRAMIHQPRLLLLDEPTTGLDPIARERFLQQLESLHRERRPTILISTHLIDEAERQDRVVFMHEGRIVADDAPAALRGRMGAIRIAVQDHNWKPPNANWHRGATGYWLSAGDAGQASSISEALATAGVPHRVAPPTLADAFELLTGKGLEEVPNRSPRRQSRLGALTP